MIAMKNEWRLFIKEMNKTGDKIEAYLKAFPKCRSRKSAATNAERLLKKGDIFNLLKINPAMQLQARTITLNELKDEIKSDVLSSFKKRDILRRLAIGELLIDEHYIRKDGTVGKYQRKANAFEILKAIEVDNKMAGDDAPEKYEHNVTFDISAIYKKAMQVKDNYKKLNKA
jgi:hypothetical protein